MKTKRRRAGNWTEWSQLGCQWVLLNAAVLHTVTTYSNWQKVYHFAGSSDSWGFWIVQRSAGFPRELRHAPPLLKRRLGGEGEHRGVTRESPWQSKQKSVSFITGENGSLLTSVEPSHSNAGDRCARSERVVSNQLAGKGLKSRWAVPFP